MSSGNVYPADPALDSLCLWLEDEHHLCDSGVYMARMLHEQARYLQAQDYVAVARILVAAGKASDKTYSFSPDYLYRLLDFLHMHREDLPPRWAMQLDYYAGAGYLSGAALDSALIYLKLARSNPASAQNLPLAGKVLNMSCLTYLSLRQVDSAVVSGMEALRIFERIRDTAQIANTYTHLAQVYQSLNAYQEEERCLAQAYAWAVQVNDTTTQSLVLFRQMHHYFAIRDTAQAVAHGKKLIALERLKKPVGKPSQFSAHHTQVLVALAQHDYATAKRHLDSCQILFDGQENLFVKRSYLNALARYEMETQGRIAHPEALEEMAQRIQASGNYRNLQELYTLLCRNAAQQGRYADAYRYRVMQAAYRDSLWQKDLAGRVFELSTQYETQKKEARIAALQQERLVVRRHTILIGCVILLALAALFLFMRQKAHAKQNALEHTLAEERHESERNRNRLMEYAQMLQERNERISTFLEEVQHSSADPDLE
ncbi:MAG TPA: hypothetical protein PK971_11095, partial [Saprospiraceae bacterium]|nr:hypothetical protein [Saprospiraceae bacterium]